jgi:hypothetical protein
MQSARKLAIFVLLPAALLLPLWLRADDLNSVLQKLNVAAKDFHTTSANVEFDTIQTDPIPDTDVQNGIAYYQRSGSTFQMAAHIAQHNNRPSSKVYTLSHGIFRVSDTGKDADAKAYSQASKYEGYLMLGFGASGSQLADKWDIKYLGSETLDNVKTDKLELFAKDPNIRKTIAKVTIWLDTSRAISLKQVFDEGEGQSWVCHYTNIKVNHPLPDNAVAFDK